MGSYGSISASTRAEVLTPYPEASAAAIFPRHVHPEGNTALPHISPVPATPWLPDDIPSRHFRRLSITAVSRGSTMSAVHDATCSVVAVTAQCGQQLDYFGTLNEDPCAPLPQAARVGGDLDLRALR